MIYAFQETYCLFAYACLELSITESVMNSLFKMLKTLANSQFCQHECFFGNQKV